MCRSSHDSLRPDGPSPRSDPARDTTRDAGFDARDARSARLRAWAARIVVFSTFALVALGLAWELWLAPLRPGGSLLALKVVPAALALRGLLARRVRTYQWWSMAVLLYVCEAAVRALSDSGLSARLASVEALLSLAAFVATLAFVRESRAPG